MPFISKMKMAIDYKDDGLWDNTFTNLKDSKNAYIIIIVLLLKSVSKKRVQFRQDLQPKIEDVDSSNKDKEKENQGLMLQPERVLGE